VFCVLLDFTAVGSLSQTPVVFSRVTLLTNHRAEMWPLDARMREDHSRPVLTQPEKLLRAKRLSISPAGWSGPYRWARSPGRLIRLAYPELTLKHLLQVSKLHLDAFTSR